MNIRFTFQDAMFALDNQQIENRKKDAEAALQTALNKTGRGNDFLGWVTLPSDVTEQEIIDLETVTAHLVEKSEVPSAR